MSGASSSFQSSLAVSPALVAAGLAAMNFQGSLAVSPALVAAGLAAMILLPDLLALDVYLAVCLLHRNAQLKKYIYIY